MGYVSEEHVFEHCKPGQMEKTCRYLLVGPAGWECGKTDPMAKQILDDRVANMSAKADNCDGV